jgi:hypothetical protein
LERLGGHVGPLGLGDGRILADGERTKHRASARYLGA